MTDEEVLRIRVELTEGVRLCCLCSALEKRWEWPKYTCDITMT